MELFPGYKAVYEEFVQRTNEDQVIKFLTDHKEEMNFSHATSCLSIGPGPGDMDAQIITALMPELQKYWAVERDPNMIVKLHGNIGKVAAGRSNLETHFYLEDAMEWEGPVQKVDIILCFHVLSHIQDVKHFLQKCKTWLAPGGCIWIMQADCREFFKQLADYFPSGVCCSTHTPPLRDIAHQIEFKCVEQYSFQHETDLSSPNKALVSFWLNREALPRDEETFLTMLNKEYPEEKTLHTELLIMFCRI